MKGINKLSLLPLSSFISILTCNSCTNHHEIKMQGQERPESEILGNEEKEEIESILKYRVGLGGERESTITIVPSRTTVHQLIQQIKRNHTLFDVRCSMVSQTSTHEEDSDVLLSDILPKKDQTVQIVVTSNLEKAQEILSNDFLGKAAWEKLGIEVADEEIPTVSDEFLRKVLALQAAGEQPILMLDLGISIKELEKESASKGIVMLRADDDVRKLRNEPCYRERKVAARWLLLVGSEHGVLPGSNRQTYLDQLALMQGSYPGFEVGEARELVTVYMLKYLQDSTYLFPGEPEIWARVKEQYQTESKKGYGARIVLGASSASGLVVDYTDIIEDAYDYDSLGLFCCFRDRAQRL